MRFRKKPVVIEAYRWMGFGSDFDYLWLIEGGAKFRRASMDSDALAIETLEGATLVSVGDWIIKGIAGEFYPCKPDIFEATYEPAD